MAIIKRKKGNATHVYEVIYEGIENGKRKYKWKLKYKLDENGNLIPSKKKTPELPTENQEEVKALAVLEQSTEPQKPEVLEAEIVADVTTTRVDKYTFGTSKTEGVVFDTRKNEGLYNPEGGAINVSRNEVKRKDINVMVSLDFKELKEEGVTIDMEYRLTPFDRAVHNAIATLWEVGHRNGMKNNEYITPRIIFQLLSGNIGKSKKISSVMRKAILRSINKMSFTEITIDNSDEAKKFGYKELKYFGSLLDIKRIEGIKINGNEVEDCIQILQSPALYNYAKLKKQVCNIDIRMLNIPKRKPQPKSEANDTDDTKSAKAKDKKDEDDSYIFRNTPENIELKDYLLQRIMAIKNQKSKMSETIRYETLYDYLRVKAPTRSTLLVKHKKIRKKVKFLLEYWEREGFIKGYKKEKEGKLFAKITINC